MFSSVSKSKNFPFLLKLGCMLSFYVFQSPFPVAFKFLNIWLLRFDIFCKYHCLGKTCFSFTHRILLSAQYSLWPPNMWRSLQHHSTPRHQLGTAQPNTVLTPSPGASFRSHELGAQSLKMPSPHSRHQLQVKAATCASDQKSCKSECPRPPPLVHSLLEWLTELSKTHLLVYHKAYNKGCRWIANEIHRMRSGRIRSTGASVPTELWCATLLCE